jgi:hypothetical protein
LLRKHTVAALATISMILAVPALAAGVAVDLSSWSVHDQPYTGPGSAPPGNWEVSGDGLSVHQGVNGRPTFFASSTAVEGHRITATFQTPTTDDDFFGVALGFGPTAPESLLVDWRQSFQDIDWGEGTGPVDGYAGLAVSRVTGIPTLNEFWGHIDSPANPSGGVEELARGGNLGSVGWVGGASYDFIIEYTTTSLDIWVDGVHEIAMTGDFPAGSLALYNFSQPDMSMSGLTTEPLNAPPTVDGSGAPDIAVDEGATGSTGGAFIDPDGDPLSLSCTGICGGFTDGGDGSWTWAQVLVEGPDSFVVTVTATDGLETASDEFTVVVDNLAPVIVASSGLAASHDIDSPLGLSVTFTDAGVLDVHTAVFDWGDATTSNGTVDEVDGSGSATAQHTYAGPGIYEVNVTVWDDDGASDSIRLGEILVFDPNDFVTGGGWIQSPTEAWAADRTHSGKATLGFVVRYDKSGAIRGNLEFQLHKGLSLHATSFDTLLIANGVATFDGHGKVNGQSGYSFEVVATDERLASATEDRFWITVSGPAGVVYDGVAALPAAGLPIKGKGIQVHDR